ncbi:hypothetical protein [Paraburkholderia tropica]|uniref:hypothetical protein n=1 Tax=Paraburkholderia tropica TaxID=92647 RepID=UPI003D2ACDC6
MLSIVDEILCVNEAQCSYLDFSKSPIELRMSKILQAIKDGKRVEQVSIMVFGRYPNAEFLTMAIIDGVLTKERVGESVCDQLLAIYPDMDKVEYETYLMDKEFQQKADVSNVKNKALDIREKATRRGDSPTGTEPK